MAKAPKTITVVNDQLAKELTLMGQRLIDFGMALRNGIAVDLSYDLPAPTTRQEKNDE